MDKSLNGKKVEITCIDKTKYIGNVIYVFDEEEIERPTKVIDIDLISGPDKVNRFSEKEIERITVIEE